SDRDAKTLRRGQRDQGGLERHQEGVERSAGQWLVDDEPLRAQGKAGASRGAGPQVARRDAGRDYDHWARARPGRGDPDSLGLRWLANQSCLGSRSEAKPRASKPGPEAGALKPILLAGQRPPLNVILQMKHVIISRREPKRGPKGLKTLGRGPKRNLSRAALCDPRA